MLCTRSTFTVYLEVSAGGVNLVKDRVGSLGASAAPMSKQGIAGWPGQSRAT